MEYSHAAELKLKKITQLGYDHFQVCIAKTQMSFSDNPKAYGRPENFNIHVRDIEIAAGAGFVIPIVGEMMRMPGLPLHPASERMTIDSQGTIDGLS